MAFRYLIKLSYLFKRYLNVNNLRIRQSAMHVSEYILRNSNHSFFSEHPRDVREKKIP